MLKDINSVEGLAEAGCAQGPTDRRVSNVVADNLPGEEDINLWHSQLGIT